MNFGLSEIEAAWRDELAEFIDGYDRDAYAALRAEARELDTERHALSFYAELCRRGWVGVGWPVDGVRAATPTERFILHEELDSAGTADVRRGDQRGRRLDAGAQRARRAGRRTPAADLRRHVAYAGAYSEPEAGSDMFGLRTQGGAARVDATSSTARSCGRRAPTSPTGSSPWSAPTPTPRAGAACQCC